MDAPQKIAVTGATGRVGHHIVNVLRERGLAVVPISRTTGVDVITGRGLAEALTGVDAIIDAATGPSPDEAAATEFFTTSARNLQDAGSQAGVKRLVVVSIIGVDKVKGGYNAAKLAQERVLHAGPIPVRILRAAQFHEFVAQIVQWGTQGDVAYVPNMRTQLVAARSVAEALADLATTTDHAPDGAITEIAGPREESMVKAAELLIARRGSTLRIEEAAFDYVDPEANESGALLPGPNATLAGPTFEEWLESPAFEDPLAN
jgi:uncharacterized protein YbjT (DUF2867 family)